MCGKERSLIKAHIIPESFYRHVQTSGQPLEILTNTAGKFPKRSQKGIYDKEILCQECEKIFGPWDDYAQKLLLQDLSDKDVIRNGSTIVAYKIPRFDYGLLKLFFLSVLWRATVSGHNFFSRVSLGPFEVPLRSMLLNGDPGSPETFAVTLSRFDDPGRIGMLDPHRDRYDGINYFRFYLAHFVSYIKVDKRPPPDSLKELYLKPGEPLIIIFRNSLRSKDVRVMRNVVVKSLQQSTSNQRLCKDRSKARGL
jgi:hypothetical protein